MSKITKTRTTEHGETADGRPVERTRIVGKRDDAVSYENPLGTEFRTPEYQQERADQLIGQAGADARIKAERAAKIDWSEAPHWATAYRVRDDGANTKAAWFDNTGNHAQANQFFDVGIGQTEIVLRSDCVEPAPQTLGSGLKLRENRLDERPGANPVAANVNGYRRLSDEELHAINTIKEQERKVGMLFKAMQRIEGVDQRWLSIARTDLERGFMAMVRSVAKPESAF